MIDRTSLRARAARGQWFGPSEMVTLLDDLDAKDAHIAVLAEACKWAEIQFQTLADDQGVDDLSDGVSHQLLAALSPDDVDVAVANHRHALVVMEGVKTLIATLDAGGDDWTGAEIVERAR